MKPSLREWTLYLLRFGSLSFGGAARLLMLKDDLVDKNQWISEKDYTRAFTFASVFPGPNLVNVVVYAGYTLFGFWGAFLGILALSVPGALISVFIVQFLNLENRHVSWVFQGFAIASTYLFSLFVWSLIQNMRAQHKGKTIFRFLLAGAVMAMSLYQVPLVWILISSIALGLLLEFRYGS